MVQRCEHMEISPETSARRCFIASVCVCVTAFVSLFVRMCFVVCMRVNNNVKA